NVNVCETPFMPNYSSLRFDTDIRFLDDLFPTFSPPVFMQKKLLMREEDYDEAKKAQLCIRQNQERYTVILDESLLRGAFQLLLKIHCSIPYYPVIKRWAECVPRQYKGYRTYVALTYIGFNIVGFVVNFWVLYVVAPLLFAPAVKVPKSILFFIFALVVGDLTTMIAMLLLIIELVFGTWRFSAATCTSYLVLDSMNKFVAPMIVFLISRTCYTTVCLDKARGERAATLKYAALQVLIALGCVMVLLWPVFAYSQVFTFYMNPNNITKEVTVIRKCGFLPPPEIQFWFNLVACITSYAVPLFGIVYWYVSVPFFLKRRAITTLVASSSMDAALRKVITTVLLLTAIYVLCWTPYWVSMFAHNIFAMEKRSRIRSAHAKIVQEQRRRFRSITDEASSHVRNALRNIPSKATSTIRSHVSSSVYEDRKADFAGNNLSDVVRQSPQPYESPEPSRVDSTVNFKESVSSVDNNDSETLL
ncbi:7 transmembrane receptor, partial [Teladorsagia circumcincta]